MLSRWPEPSDTPPSPWIPAVHLLLEGVSKTAMGVGLLLGQLAIVVERHSASLPRSCDGDAVTWRRPPAALDRAAA